MSITVTMPALGESVTEGTVTRWLKAVGDTVVADDLDAAVGDAVVDAWRVCARSGTLARVAALLGAVLGHL